MHIVSAQRVIILRLLTDLEPILLDRARGGNQTIYKSNGALTHR